MKLSLTFLFIILFSSYVNSDEERKCFARVMGKLVPVVCKNNISSEPTLGVGKRSETEIKSIFSKHQGRVYARYNTLLKQDSSLGGKFSFTLTIEESGSVSDCVYTYEDQTEKLEALAQRLCSDYYEIDFLYKQESGSTQFTHNLNLLPFKP